ncbi:cytochrome P450 4C1-like [Periplaneta americana]|uniref:cytochrome P450 4C1-like n=1 Tax=Periplaneta americana TaxID=6978 RepID=UPI0037E9C2CF
MELITTLFLTLITFFFIVISLYKTDSKRARLLELFDKMPGPPSYPIFGSALPYIIGPRHECFKKIYNTHYHYMPIFKWWAGHIPVVSLDIPQYAELLLNNSKTIDKAKFYKYLQPWLGTGLLTSKGAKWHSHRKMLTPTFHFKILDNFVSVFSENSNILVQKLQGQVGKDCFNIYPYITHCALDIICESAMGVSVNAQEDETSEYVTSVYKMSELVRDRMERPWLHPDFLHQLSSNGRKQKKCLKILHGFTNKVIQERKLKVKSQQGQQSQEREEDEVLGKKKRMAFLDLLLEVSEGGTKLTDEEIREEVDTFMFEGHDTTAAGICFTLYLLGLHPEIQDRVYEELESIFQDSDRSPTMKDLNDMKYLECVIKESLRLYPSVPEIGRELTKEIEIGGYTLPAGAVVLVFLYLIHRNPEHFPNPEKFDPDNFLPERIARRHPYAYMPFSAGPRNCIGQKFAILEEKAVVSSILRNYKVTSLDKREDLKIVTELILRSVDGFRLQITPRKRQTPVENK